MNKFSENEQKLKLMFKCNSQRIEYYLKLE